MNDQPTTFNLETVRKKVSERIRSLTDEEMASHKEAMYSFLMEGNTHITMDLATVVCLVELADRAFKQGLHTDTLAVKIRVSRHLN